MSLVAEQTLAIMFTDIERSTELLESRGEPEWLAALDGHGEEVKRLAHAHGGRLVKGTGDGFLLAFTSTRGAVRCGVELLESTTGMRIRIGVHVGEATIRAGDLHGRAVVKAARIAAAAAGGELLVSALVRELVHDDEHATFGEPRELDLRGLDGVHVVYPIPRKTPVALHSVVIADDSAIVRDGLRALLVAAGLHVPAAVEDGEALVAAVARHDPDVVISDIRMPPTFTDEGMVAAAQIRRDQPSTGIVLLSQQSDPAIALRLLEIAPGGGVGYLLKDRVSDLEMLLSILHRVHTGEVAIDAAVSARMVARGERSSDLRELTARELEVLGLIAEGRSNRAIAEALFVTAKTLEGHISQIFLKLGLRDTTDESRRVAAVLAYLGRNRE